MALRGRFKNLKNDAGVLVTVAALTATDYSETLGLGGLSSFGIMVDCGTVSGTTSPTLDITPQISYDSGTTWVTQMPAEFGSTTAAACAQMTATGHDRIGCWDNPFPADSDLKLRFAFTITGTGSPSFTLTKVKFFGRS
jgi:hypothetical protein